ncbi:hypothetical protein [Pseudomonas sp. PB3P13]
MITLVPLTISIEGRQETAQLVCDSSTVSIMFTRQNGYNKTYSDRNFYKCFGRVREDHPDILFLCKGSKINVHPSSMSAQMTLGLKAYELVLGKPAEREDLVYIFDYEEQNLTNKPNEQKEFFMQWIRSDKSSSKSQ